MRKVIKAVSGILSAGILSILALTVYIQSALPDNFFVAEGEEFYISSKVSITASTLPQSLDAKVYDKSGNIYSLNLKLFESVPIKQVQVQVINRKMLVPGGSPFGIKMFTDGVMVVGMSDIQVGVENKNPAKEAGLKIGDILTGIDGKKVERNEDVADFISSSGGNEVKISIIRSNQPLTIYLKPIQSEFDDVYKAGIWVRDSSAGIGTLTFYDPETQAFAGLGHAVCDVDTGAVMPLAHGEIMDVNISGVNIGQSGRPGELKGSFAGEIPIGKLMINCESGIFGVLSKPYFGANAIPMALKQEIQTGPAEIYSTISGNKPQSFRILIERVNYADTTPTKNMIIRIIDEGLLAKTGGIVQGMSGSPIIQNGKLIGAVTHVFVNDPTRGYGIFIENMDKELNIVDNYRYSA